MSVDSRLRAIESMVNKLNRRMANVVTRGTLMASDDSKGLQKQRVVGFYGEEVDQVMHMQPYGLTGMAPSGSDALMLSMMGERDGTVIASVSDPNTRPKDLDPGSVMLYDGNGQQVYLQNDKIVVTGKGDVEVNTEGNVSVTATGDMSFDVAGNMTIKAAGDFNIESASFKQNGSNISSDHVHTGVQTGGGNTGVPLA